VFVAYAVESLAAGGLPSDGPPAAVCVSPRFSLAFPVASDPKCGQDTDQIQSNSPALVKKSLRHSSVSNGHGKKRGTQRTPTRREPGQFKP
jgi:hypothetical protein